MRKERWALSWPAKAAVCVAALAFLCLGARRIHPFLAGSNPLAGPLLVVEGWIPPYTLPEVARQFRSASYDQVLVVRPMYNVGDKYESGQYAADYIAEHLALLGVPKDRLHTVFLEASHKDRTYLSALGTKTWLRQRGIKVNRMDVATLGPHARRSRLLFQKAFGKEVKIGVYAAQDRYYDPVHWWRSSEGIREVPFEALAYLYVRIFFHPSDPGESATVRPLEPRP